MNRVQSHENGSNSTKFYANSPAINRKFVKIGSHFHEISLRSPNYQTGSNDGIRLRHKHRQSEKEWPVYGFPKLRLTSLILAEFF